MKRVLLVTIVTVLIAGAALAQGGKPWEAWQPPAVTLPQPNGFDTYLQAFELKNKTDKDLQVSVWADAARAEQAQPPDPWGEGPPQLPLPDRLNLYPDVLKLVHAALAQECRIPPPASFTEPMPYLASFRSAVRLLAMEAEVARLNGDDTGAANSALDAFKVAQDAASQRTLISYLVGIACEALAGKFLDSLMPEFTKPDECEHVLTRLLQLEETRLPLIEALNGEEAMARLAFKSLMENAEQRQAVLEELAQTPDAKQKMLDSLGLKGWEAIGQTYEAFRQAAALPYQRQPRPLPTPADPLVAALTPRVDRLLFKDAQALTALHLREAELAVRAYLLDQKRLPESLRAVAPQYIPQVPADPFGEGPLRSVMAAGKLTVYSVGPDGVDDDGRPVTDKVPGANSTGDLIVTVAAK